MLFRLSLQERPPQASEGGDRSELPLTFKVKVKGIRFAHPLTRCWRSGLSHVGEAKKLQPLEAREIEPQHSRFLAKSG